MIICHFLPFAFAFARSLKRMTKKVQWKAENGLNARQQNDFFVGGDFISGQTCFKYLSKTLVNAILGNCWNWLVLC